jgi:hypothetical protein
MDDDTATGRSNAGLRTCGIKASAEKVSTTATRTRELFILRFAIATIVR